MGRLTRTIVHDLGQAIVTGKFAPNEVLPIEAELSAHYDTSRSVLREAIKVLVAKGLITARPRLGTSVSPSAQWNLFDPDVLQWILEGEFSVPLLIEFMQMRLGIEPIAASLAAETATPEQKQRILHSLHRMELASQGQDDPLTSDIEFHLAILNASNNRFLQRMRPMVSAALRFSIRQSDSHAPKEFAKVGVHRTVSDAILVGDAAGAAAASKSLLDDAMAFIKKSA